MTHTHTVPSLAHWSRQRAMWAQVVARRGK